ncbi:glycosyltransferase family 2 protein [Halanaerobium congolense]|uniref:glycosyltransferase family 2 protein n=1 Tax=Halanaerobium congolense TaxID=54121 RepID=UPI000913D6A0|nr:glycosyltransferase family 2 protein [Halanaerobium congolense]SHN11293.1 Glycosyltransferase involved in cell wall bisynthesis [Halanaerobium congolense]
MIPKISIIIPIYNNEKYLSKCIESVIKQNYNNKEIILVNDGSTDNSANICDNYAHEYKDIKVIHQANNGAAAARNIGLDNSSGDYIIFLDSDDFWVDNCLNGAVKVLMNSKKNIDIMFLQSAKLKTNGIITKFNGYDFKDYNKTEFMNYIKTKNKIEVSACTKIINARLFKNSQSYFQNNLLVEDVDWFFKIIDLANYFTTYNKGFYIYRLRDDSSSSTKTEKRIHDFVYILNKWINHVQNNIENEQEKSIFFFMLGYEYEILLSNFYNYPRKIRKRYFEQIKKMFWILDFRNKPRTFLIKVIYYICGIKCIMKILNFYLNHRLIV